MLFLALGVLGLVSYHTVAPAHATTFLISGALANVITDPFRSRLYVADIGSNDVIVLNTTTDEVVARVDVGSRPYGMDVSADGKELYVAIRGENALAIISLGDLTLSRKIQLTTQPYDVAAGPLGLVYVTSDDNYGYPRVIDTIHDRELGKITSAGQIYTQSLLRVSSDRTQLYVGQGGGLSYAAIFQFKIIGSNATWLRTADGGSNLGDFQVSPDGSRVYVASGASAVLTAPYDITVFSTTNMSLIGTLHTTSYPNSVSLALNGRLVFGTHDTAEVRSFNATTFGIINAYPTGSEAIQVRAREDGKKVYLMTGGYYEGNTRYVEVLDTVPDTSPPTWPNGSSLAATSVGVSTINLTWTQAIDDVRVASYQLYVNSTYLTSVDRNTLSYQVTGLQPQRSYLFRVEAQDSAGLSSTGGPTAMVTTLPDMTAPVWPPGSLLTAVSTTYNSAVLSWPAATDDVAVVAYRVYMNSALHDTISTVASQNQYTASGLTPSTTYLFKVEAGDSSNNWSINGPSLSVTTPSKPNTTYVGAYLEVQTYYLNVPYPGGSLTLESNFTAVGTQPVQITGMTITSDLGTWTIQGVPFQLGAGHGRRLNNTETIPSSALVGSHTATITVQWLGYDSTTGIWAYAPPLIFSGHIPVQGATSPPPTAPPPTTPQNKTIPNLLESLFTTEGLLIAAGIAGIAAFSTVMIALATRRPTQGTKTTWSDQQCPRCGQWNGPNAKFCMNCGNPIAPT